MENERKLTTKLPASDTHQNSNNSNWITVALEVVGTIDPAENCCSSQTKAIPSIHFIFLFSSQKLFQILSGKTICS